MTHPRGTSAWSPFSRALGLVSGGDEHLVLIAAANLDRALQKLPKRVRHRVQLPNPTRRALWLLRNIYEHWDELRKQYRSGTQPLRGAAQKLKAEFPNADPWSFTFDPKSGDIILADVVALTPLLGELRRLEARVLRLERRLTSRSSGPAAPAAERPNR